MQFRFFSVSDESGSLMGRARDHLGKVTVFYAVLKRQICSLDSSFKNATVSLVYLHFLLYGLHCSKSVYATGFILHAQVHSAHTD